eukprot:CAMPEP_0181390112 /NCGR_PEP_ID=MMETSP1106-20121128/25304_1 /TAXON_ID=81844 /ORGANISM="Mantoniella antarctica, Strain SL-175" /LENGTH=73 /DNA_ID=CAMNT_0023510987 /DNA_START=41 /DNA_END=263 /DNA_ORIENTATION=+
MSLFVRHMYRVTLGLISGYGGTLVLVPVLLASSSATNGPGPHEGGGQQDEDEDQGAYVPRDQAKGHEHAVHGA